MARIEPRSATARGAAWRGIALATLLSACSSVTSYRYGPLPHGIPVRPAQDQDPIALVLFSCRGIVATAEPEGHEVLVRIEVENLLDEPLRLQAEEVRLVDAELLSFGPPRIARESGQGGLEVAPRSIAFFDVSFPFPGPGSEPDLSALNVRLALEHSAGRALITTTFERLGSIYYDPYFYADGTDPLGPQGYDPYGPHDDPQPSGAITLRIY